MMTHDIESHEMMTYDSESKEMVFSCDTPKQNKKKQLTEIMLKICCPVCTCGTTTIVIHAIYIYYIILIIVGLIVWLISKPFLQNVNKSQK